MHRFVVALLLLPLLGGPAYARKDKLAEACRKGERLARARKYDEAAKHYAKAIRAAQRKGDVLAEQRLARSLLTGFARLKFVRTGQRGVGMGETRAALAVLLSALDAKRRSAFISAPHLACVLLREATRAGDPGLATGAAAVVAKNAGAGGAGKHAQAMSDYAKGLLALTAGKHADATAALRQALDVVTTEGWLVDAFHVGTELAALRRALGDDEGASQALADVARRVTSKIDPYYAFVWRDLMQRRLGDAPEHVTAPYRKVAPVGPVGTGMPGTAGGRGRGGAREGGGDISAMGTALPRFSSRKPLFTVRRIGYKFELRHGFDEAFHQTQGFQKYVHSRADGGVILQFWGKAVALSQLDVTGLEGNPSEVHEPSPFHAFYPLATGETWGVNKKGEVTIR